MMRARNVVSSCTATALLCAVSCFPPPPRESNVVVEKVAPPWPVDTLDKRRKPEISASQESERDGRRPGAYVETARLIPVSAWPGKRFLLLERVQMFRTFGHHMYTSGAFEDDPQPPRAGLELESHRLAYEPFAGHTLTVTSVEQQSDGEYLVVARLDTLELTVYGKTSRGIIEGLLDTDDLASARKRWQGKTVYSRRRLIDVYDSTASKFTNLRVSILEPLKVFDVHPGIIPLPPKPIWLIVDRADGSRGIIPLHYSWTNVLEEKRSPGMPWEQDIFEANPRDLYPRWEQYAWETIDNHHVYVGMTKEQVTMSWGEPRQVVQDSARIEWVYGKSKLTFKADTLAAISER